jgi:hypothetical protein
VVDVVTVPDVIVGIDPGNRGAIAAWNVRTSKISLWYMPLMVFPGRLRKCKKLPARDRRPKLDIVKLRRLLRAVLKQVETPERMLVILEDVHAMYGDGATQAFAFGRNLGAIEGVLQSLGITPATVPPEIWRVAVVGKGTTKAESRAVAKRRFRKLDFSLAKSEALAEALLLAEYGLNNLKEMLARRQAWPLTPESRLYLATPPRKKKKPAKKGQKSKPTTGRRRASVPKGKTPQAKSGERSSTVRKKSNPTAASKRRSTRSA